MLLVLFLAENSTAQNEALEVFRPLLGKVWKADGEWGDGSKFIQETTFKFSLEGNLVIADSKGYVDKEQTSLGHRNHGIRQFDKASGTIKFWEFDVFGGVTQGTLMIKDKDIYYQYEYGGSTITDLWEFVDDNTYNFKVGSFVDNEWKQIYLQTQFITQ